MNHQRHPYETGGQQNTYSHGRHIASDAIRGFVVGMRGWLEGRKMKREASTAKEQGIADEAFRQRTLDLQERQLTMTDAFNRDKLTTDVDYKSEVVNLQKELQESQAAIAERRAALDEKIAENQNAIAGKTLALQETQGEAQIQAQKELTQLIETNKWLMQERRILAGQKAQASAQKHEGAMQDTRGQQQIESIQATGQQQIEGIQAAGEQERQTNEERIQQESQAKLLLESLKTLTGGGELDDEAWKRYRGIFSDANSLQAVKDMANIAQGYQTAMQGFVSASTGGETRTLLEQRIAASVGKTREQIQAELEANRHLLGGEGFTMADMAMINGYQRMIDPGATVREGDVHALLSALGAGGKLQAVWESALQGGQFDDKARERLAAMILDNYRTNLRNTFTIARTPIQGLIDKSGLSGVSMQDFLPGWVDMGGVTIEDIKNSRDPFAGRATPQAEEGRVPGENANANPQALSDEWIKKIVTATTEIAAPIIDADPNFDEADQQQVRTRLDETLKAMGEKAGVGDAYLQYADQIFTEAMRLLGIVIEGGAPE